MLLYGLLLYFVFDEDFSDIIVILMCDFSFFFTF